MPEIPQESIATILYHLSTIDGDLAAFRVQLKEYDTTRENDLKLQRINDTASRMEADLRIVRTSAEDMKTLMLTKEGESKQRDSDTRASQAALQIKVLASAVTLIVGALVTLLIFYITHL